MIIRSLTDKEIERILSEEADRQIADLIQETIEDNFIRIRREVQEIVDCLLPTGNRAGGKEEFGDEDS